MVPAPQMASRALWWQCVPNGQALQQPKAVDRKPQPPACYAEESLTNSARGTLVRRRTCGFLSPVLSAGPLDLAASRAPSDLFPLAYRLKSVGSRCATRTMRLFKN